VDTTDFVDCLCKPFFWDRFLNGEELLVADDAIENSTFDVKKRKLYISSCQNGGRKRRRFPHFHTGSGWIFVGLQLLMLRIGTIQNHGCSSRTSAHRPQLQPVAAKPQRGNDPSTVHPPPNPTHSLLRSGCGGARRAGVTD
jgi:hypothetical protein